MSARAMERVRERLARGAQALFAFGPAPQEKRSIFRRMEPMAKAALVAIPMALASGIGAIEIGNQTRAWIADPAAPKAAARQAEPKTPGEWLAARIQSLGGEASNYDLAKAVLPKDTFLSLATAVEDVKTKVYFDPAGANIGMGYNITLRSAEFGEERVESDLVAAGMRESHAKALAEGERKAAKAASISVPGAVILLEKTAEDYRERAREDLGAEIFDKLPEHKQAALAYLAYNAGDIRDFRKMLRAIRSGDDQRAMMEMSTWWRDSEGKFQENHRLRAWVQAAWLGPQKLEEALEDPHAFEQSYANKQGKARLAREAARAEEARPIRMKADAKARLAERRARMGIGEGAAPQAGKPRVS